MKEGGIQALEDLAASYQTVGSLLRTRWQAEPVRKNEQIKFNRKIWSTTFD
jgi:hypothetical protein